MVPLQLNDLVAMASLLLDDLVAVVPLVSNYIWWSQSITVLPVGKRVATSGTTHWACPLQEAACNYDVPWLVYMLGSCITVCLAIVSWWIHGHSCVWITHELWKGNGSSWYTYLIKGRYLSRIEATYVHQLGKSFSWDVSMCYQLPWTFYSCTKFSAYVYFGI